MPDEQFEKILEAPIDVESVGREIAALGSGLPSRLNADPDQAEKGLAQLVLTLVELLRQLMERQAVRRIDAGSLSEAEIERLGITFMRLEARMNELKREFGLEDADLELRLGPLRDLM